jgi:CRP-like cAMP-binding protein
MSGRDARALRDELAAAIDRGKFKKAIECILELEQLEPRDAAWPKRAAEAYRRIGRTREAIAAYERSAERYAQGGFLVQAIAVCKQILQLDPQHSETLRRLARMSEERRTGPIGVQAITAGLDAIPQLIVGRTTGPIPRVDPATILPDDREVAMLDVPAASAAAVAARAPAFALPDDAPPARAVPTAPPAVGSAPAGGGGRTPARPAPPPIPPPRAFPPPLPPPPRPHGAWPTTPQAVSLEPGKPLDSLQLSEVLAGAEGEFDDDGESSGIIVIPLEDDDGGAPAVAPGSSRTAAAGADDASGELELDLEDELPEPRALSEAARRALSATPLLAGLDPVLLGALVERLGVAHLEPGQVLFREGDVGDSLYIVAEGEVAVISEGPPRAELSRLLPGAFFGEVALITETPRSATIAAVAPTELLVVSREMVRELVGAHPDMLRVILRFIRDRLVERMIRTSPLFMPFDDRDRRALAARFEFLEVEPQTELLHQGARPDALHLLLAGRAEVLRDIGDVPGAARRGLGSLGPGDVFGEMALVGGEVSLATVVTRTKVLALRMPAATFREVIMTHPQILAYVGELAETRRRQAEAPEDSGDVVDLRVDLI